MSVTRPIDIGEPGQGGFPNLSDDERQRLREENEGGRLGLTDLGEPGTRFSRDTRQVTTGRYFDDPDARQAILNESYASRQAMGIGDTLTLRDTRRRSATGASRGCGATAAVGGEAPCSSAPHS